MQSGDTLLLVDGSSDHLWIVISDTTVDPDQLVVVYLLTHRGHLDQSCILRVGDHPFIKHDTCVNYPGARIVHRQRLEAVLAAGKAKKKDPVSAEVLSRIQQAVGASDIPSDCLKKLVEQGVASY